jgi:hypothetical protein
MPLLLPVVTVIMIQSMTRMNRNGDNKHPCRTPVLTSKLFEIWPVWVTLQVML